MTTSLESQGGRGTLFGMALAIDVLTKAQAAQLLDLPVTRIHQWLRDGTLAGAEAPDGRLGVPADFIQEGAVVKHLTAVITQLRDARYQDDEIVEWLYREDESLPGSPIQALRENRGTEVKRRAQVAGF